MVTKGLLVPDGKCNLCCNQKETNNIYTQRGMREELHSVQKKNQAEEFAQWVRELALKS